MPAYNSDDKYFLGNHPDTELNSFEMKGLRWTAKNLRVAKGIFDPSANEDERTKNASYYLKDEDGGYVVIPDNSVIIDALVDVITTFTDGASDTEAIALSLQAANDLVSSIAISDGTNVWDAGIHGTLMGNFALDGSALTAIAMAAARAGSLLKTTAERMPYVTLANTADLTAGKMFVYILYLVSE